MTKFNDFMNNEPQNLPDDMQKLDGNYGCQQCDDQVTNAWFNERDLEIIWFCKEQHQSSIKLG
jgi:hypothetical protein